jgi:tellurite resistance protein
MGLNFNISQSFMAIGIATISADERCTAGETEMLLSMFKKLNLLPGLTEEEYDAEWERVFYQTFDKIHREFPKKGIAMSPNQIEAVFDSIAQSLPSEHYEDLFRLAVAIALCDGLDDREMSILVLLQQKLGLAPEAAQTLRSQLKKEVALNPVAS